MPQTNGPYGKLAGDTACRELVKLPTSYLDILSSASTQIEVEYWDKGSSSIKEFNLSDLLQEIVEVREDIPEEEPTSEGFRLAAIADYKGKTRVVAVGPY